MKFMLGQFIRILLFSILGLWVVSYSYAYTRVEPKVLFEKNIDKSHQTILFKAKTASYLMDILDDGFDFKLARNSRVSVNASIKNVSLNVRFLNAKKPQQMIWENELDDSKPLRRVGLKDVWKGIDIIYYDKQGEVEYDFIVSPGVDPSVIQLHFKNISDAYLDASGNLIVDLEVGKFIQQKPFVYQEFKTKEGTNKKEVTSSYVLLDEGRVAFTLGAYDKHLPLIIDPVISFASFLGGKYEDSGKALSLDASGNIIVVGDTRSPDFPSQNAFDSRLGRGDQDVFVSKFSADGRELVFSTYLGEKLGIEKASDLAIDDIGNIYITGTTTGIDFPVTPLAYQTAVSAGEHAFVVKLDQAGKLIYATYIVGASAPRIAVDAKGQVYVSGLATQEFKTTFDALQSFMPDGKNSSAFLLKLNEKGSNVVFSTFISGSGVDSINDLTLDARGNVYLVGETSSADFPLQHAFQNVLKGGSDGFVMKLDASASVLLYSTYLGGSDKDAINAIKLDASDNMYLAGETFSDDYPVKHAFQSVKAGSYLLNSILGNAFVTKLSSTGDSLRFSSFLGGEVCYPGYCQPAFGQNRYSGDKAIDVQLDNEGHAYVIGLAESYTFPLVDSVVAKKQSDYEKSVFVSKLSESGSVLLYSSLIHVSEQAASAMRFNQAAIDMQGSVYITGGYDPTFKTSELAWQKNYAGGYYDAVFLKLASHEPALSISSSKNPASKNELISLDVALNDVVEGSSISFWNKHIKLGEAPLINGIASMDVSLNAGVHQIIATYQDGTSAGDSSILYQLVNPDSNCQPY